MKKRDVLLILGLLALVCVLLVTGLAQRGRTAPAPAVTESPAASEEPESGTGAALAEGDGTVPDAVAAFFDEYPAESYLVVTTSSGVHAPIPLNEENEFRLTQADGSENVVHIGKNSFYMHSSNCENQNCVGQGEVTLENRETRLLFNMIICLPHNLSLELLTREETEKLMTELYTQVVESGALSGADGHAQ